MHQYYDIHTHKQEDLPADCVTIVSLYSDFGKVDQLKYCSIGMHPRYLYNYMQDFSSIEMKALNKHVVAIGECGIDKLSLLDMELQNLIFLLHLKLANNVRKPLIVHCVKAYEEMLQIFSEHPPEVPVIFHGFNKKETVATKLLKQGYYLSFGAALMNENSTVIGLFQKIDASRFFLETDDADVSIKDIYAAAARIRNVSEEDIILQVRKNFEAVFLKDV